MVEVGRTSGWELDKDEEFLSMWDVGI
jgi:hypothetical protein